MSQRYIVGNTRASRLAPSQAPIPQQATQQPNDRTVVHVYLATFPLGTRPLTLHTEALPALLGDLRTLADVRRYLRLYLFRTLAAFGLQANQMSHCGVILDPRTGTITGPTADDNVWRQLISPIVLSQPPSIVLACFPPQLLQDMYGNLPQMIRLRDGYDPNLGQTIQQVSIQEAQRYRNIFTQVNPQPQVTAVAPRTDIVPRAPYATFLPPGPQTMITPNSASVPAPGYNPFSNMATPRISGQFQYIDPRQMLPSTSSNPRQPTYNRPNTQPSNPNTTNTPQQVTGPKGRNLVASTNKPAQKQDYSKATLFPRRGREGFKEESDKCLTCIRNNRKCSGTTMHLQKNVRRSNQGQWKCDQCHPKRRCLWRPAMDKVYTYDEMFRVDGGTGIQRNTREGRKKAAEERARGLQSLQQPGAQAQGQGRQQQQQEQSQPQSGTAPAAGRHASARLSAGTRAQQQGDSDEDDGQGGYEDDDDEYQDYGDDDEDLY